jgi:hypothetical protein
MQNFCYKLGVVATKLATVESGILWWSIKPVNRCEWYHQRGWESLVKTFVKAVGPCQWQQKSTQSNPYRVQIDDPHFFVIKPTRCTNFTNLFCHEILHVSDSSSVHHQEFIHCTFNNGIRMSYRFVDSFRSGPVWHTYTTAECTVNKLMMDRRTVRNM